MMGKGLHLQVPSGKAMVGFEWGKQDLSVNGDGEGPSQQQHANGNGPLQQQGPQASCSSVQCTTAADAMLHGTCAGLQLLSG